jgi:ComF family protein
MLDAALQAGGFADDIGVFVPVPLHWLRRISRGYNHSAVLVKHIDHPKAAVNDDLARVKYTRRQPGMASPAARARNVKGAFAVRRGHEFKGKRICLVDDIKTTGATLNECAKTLKEAGAAKVWAIVLGVAGQSR